MGDIIGDIGTTEERIDDLQINGLFIIQHPKLFCFGMDAVLLSNFVNTHKNDRVVDLCCGNGIIPILLSAKTNAKQIYGLEIVSENVDLATRSVKMNGLSDRVHIVEGDVRKATEIFGKKSFEVVTCNPPYMNGNQGLKNKSDVKTIARHEVLLDMKQMLRQTVDLLVPKGHAFFVYRTFRLAELLAEMRAVDLEPKRMQLVHSYVESPPKLVLVEGVKNSKPYLVTEPPFIVYDKPNQYTKMLMEAYGKIEE